MKTYNKKNTNPLDKKEKVRKSKDKHIDKDFEGYPHNPAREEMINPKTKEERVEADLKLGKENTQEKNNIDEIESDGSAGAFDATEAFPGRFEDEK